MTLILARDWRPEDVERLLADPEVQAPREEFSRNAVPGGGDRFCLNRVILAEVADPRLNRRLNPVLQTAHLLVRSGVGALLRYGVKQWRTVVKSGGVKEGAQITVVSPASGLSRQRTVVSVDSGWGDLRLVSLAPISLE